ncbi:hypothetical protein CALVIDRAFT_540315 [Calocera viscosa TUFC12733]|uniref:GATA-type domain-containing protein n=1 Tax=Calocera viscosa (strain TUFC12733) TaxID=1330018 RepID=A0A167IXK7_CALVF|nr:hypothetical protein CALVIDRAFT_540315 [Calocera viscosa TUFC12733]
MCNLCRARSTPAWRKDSEGRYVCNACGLRLRQRERLRMGKHTAGSEEGGSL